MDIYTYLRIDRGLGIQRCGCVAREAEEKLVEMPQLSLTEYENTAFQILSSTLEDSKKTILGKGVSQMLLAEQSRPTAT